MLSLICYSDPPLGHKVQPNFWFVNLIASTIWFPMLVADQLTCWHPDQVHCDFCNPQPFAALCHLQEVWLSLKAACHYLNLKNGS
jgi:hypothetical protein